MLFLIIGMFVASIFGLLLLFTLKAWEVRHARTIAPSIRVHADAQAILLKAQLMRSGAEAAKVVPFIALLTRLLIHKAALGFASAAHFAAEEAHRLADFVSHKHSFKRQEPRSDFLRQISDRPTPITAPESAPIQTPRRSPRKKVPPAKPLEKVD